jgi:predicted nucleic acid-binding protein
LLNSSTVCVDANLAIKLVDQSESRAVETLFEEWARQDCVIVAPYLLRYEMTNIVRQLTRHGRMTEGIAANAIGAMVLLPITLFADTNHHARALRFSIQFNLPATYDAHYLALAEELDCEFWTADKRLARAVRDEFDWVHLFE